MDIGVVVLEVVAQELLPTLAAEVGTRLLRQAAEGVARSTADRAVAERACDGARTKGLALVEGAGATAVLSHMPGRVRLQVGGLRGNTTRAQQVETALQALDGVQRVEASVVTGNVLVQFEPQATNLACIRGALEPARPAPTRERRATARHLQLVGA